MKIALVSMLAVIACASVALAAPAATPAPFRLEPNAIVTPRHVFVQGDSGLPQQIQIKAETYEMPLEKRGPKPADADLALVGRGPQLRAPMRLEAIAGGKTVALVAAEAPKVAMENDVAVSTAKVAGAGVSATVEARYAKDGAMSVKITYGGGAVDSLAVVMDIAGAVDTVIAGAGADAKALPFASDDYALAADEGVVWGNGKAVAAAPTPTPAPATAPATMPTSGPARKPAISRGAPGVVPHMFFGNGDRGWTFLAAGDAGWVVDPAAATMLLIRDKDGLLTWKALLVNKASKLDGEKTVAFMLLTHPAAARPLGFRKAAWQELPFAGKTGAAAPLTAAGRTGDKGVVRADAASVYESLASAAQLQGIAGGDAASAASTLAETYPTPLFRYLAGTHTSLPAWLSTNSGKLIRPGQSDALDRMAIGRALLNDIGLDAATVAHKALAAKVMAALTQFGYFEADGKTDYLPYWRSREFIRYGEPFTGKDAFSITAEDPMARVFTSVWRRSAPAGKKGTQAMILVVNETDVPVRQQLYVLNVARVFGGPNRITAGAVIGTWDFPGIPADSDWASKSLARSSSPGDRRTPNPHLMDMEDSGYVTLASSRGGQEIYGPLFIPAHSFRLLYGATDADVLTPAAGPEKK